LYIRQPSARQFIKEMFDATTAINFEFMGYGLFAGKKQESLDGE